MRRDSNRTWFRGTLSRLPQYMFVSAALILTPTPAALAQGEDYSATLGCSDQGGAVTIRLSGIWRDCCAPRSPMLSVSGDRIDFQVDYSYSGGCCDAPTPWCAMLTTAPLPDGVYRVFTTILPDGEPLERPPFVVDCARRDTCRLVPLPDTPGGVNGAVWALTTWDPDGPGPQVELLIAAGSFTQAAGVAANNIAAWDGATWRPLGPGIGGPSAGVYALGVFQGQLIAAGSFTLAGGAPASSIARWDGVQWRPLAEGLGGLAFPTVLAMAVHDSNLIVAGAFLSAGGAPARRIAGWDAAHWHALGDGLGAGDPLAFEFVFALASYQGNLIAGGQFRNPGGVRATDIARWDGATWGRMDAGFITREASVDALIVQDGTLLVATAGCATNGCLGSIREWDGSAWRRRDAGLASRPINALAPHDAGLIAATGSRVPYPLACPPNEILVGDGPIWSPVYAGNAYCLAFARFHGETIVAGIFNGVGGADGNNLVRLSCTPPPCPADFNHSGAVDSDDLFAYLAAFFSDLPSADFNHDATINSQDFFDFLAAFFAGC